MSEFESRRSTLSPLSDLNLQPSPAAPSRQGEVSLQKSSFRNAALQLVSSYSSLEQLSGEVLLRQLQETQLDATRTTVQDLQLQIEVSRLERLVIQRVRDAQISGISTGVRVDMERLRANIEGRSENRLGGVRAIKTPELAPSKADFGALPLAKNHGIQGGISAENTSNLTLPPRALRREEKMTTKLGEQSATLSLQLIQDTQLRQRRVVGRLEEERVVLQRQEQGKDVRVERPIEQLITRFGGRGWSARLPSKRARSFFDILGKVYGDLPSPALRDILTGVALVAVLILIVGGIMIFRT